MYKRVFFQNKLFIKSFRFSFLFWFSGVRSSWIYFDCLLRLLNWCNFFLRNGWCFSYDRLLWCFVNDLFRNSINDYCLRCWSNFSYCLFLFTFTLFLFFIRGSIILLLRFFLRNFCWLWFINCFRYSIFCFILHDWNLFNFSLFWSFCFILLFNFLLIHYWSLFYLFLFVFCDFSIIFGISWFALLRFFLLFDLCRFLNYFWRFFRLLFIILYLLFLCLLFDNLWDLFCFCRLTIHFFWSLNNFFWFRAFCWSFNWRSFNFLLFCYQFFRLYLHFLFRNWFFDLFWLFFFRFLLLITLFDILLFFYLLLNCLFSIFCFRSFLRFLGIFFWAWLFNILIWFFLIYLLSLFFNFLSILGSLFSSSFITFFLLFFLFTNSLPFLWIIISRNILLLCWGRSSLWVCSDWRASVLIWIVIKGEYRADQNCNNYNDNFP